MLVLERIAWDAVKYVLLPAMIAVMVVSIPRYWKKTDLEAAFELGRRVGRKKPPRK